MNPLGPQIIQDTKQHNYIRSYRKKIIIFKKRSRAIFIRTFLYIEEKNNKNKEENRYMERRY